MSSVLSSRSRSCCPGALESVPGASIAGSRGGTVRAPRQKIAEAIPSRRPSSSTSTSTSAAAKKAPALLLPSLSLPKFSWSGGRLSKAKTKLMNLISKSDRGTNPSGPSREEVEAAIDELYAAAPRSALFPLENNPAGIDGKWKLVREPSRRRVSSIFRGGGTKFREENISNSSSFSSVFNPPPNKTNQPIKPTETQPNENSPGLDQREGGPVGDR